MVFALMVHNKNLVLVTGFFVKIYLLLTDEFLFVKVIFVIKKTAILIAAASSILLISPVLALDSTSTARPVIQNKIQKIDTRIAQKEANVEQKMKELEQRKLTEASKAAMFRQKLEQRKEVIASHEAQIRAKIQAFKDKQKAEIASRVNTNLNKINQNQTDQMIKHLDLMSQLLDKLATKVSSNSSDIKDPTLTNQAITDARDAVAKAKTAVEAQAQKDYTINVTTETKIRVDAQAKRDQLHTDITTVRKLVIDAKQSVSNAVRIAKSGKIATPSASEKEGTTSGKQ